MIYRSNAYYDVTIIYPTNKETQNLKNIKSREQYFAAGESNISKQSFIGYEYDIRSHYYDENDALRRAKKRYRGLVKKYPGFSVVLRKKTFLAGFLVKELFDIHNLDKIHKDELQNFGLDDTKSYVVKKFK